jgi:hypothetical protein
VRRGPDVKNNQPGCSSEWPGYFLFGYGLLAFFESANIAFLVTNFFAVPVGEPRDTKDDAEERKNNHPMEKILAHVHPPPRSKLALKDAESSREAAFW